VCRLPPSAFTTVIDQGYLRRILYSTSLLLQLLCLLAFHRSVLIRTYSSLQDSTQSCENPLFGVALLYPQRPITTSPRPPHRGPGQNRVLLVGEVTSVTVTSVPYSTVTIILIGTGVRDLSDPRSSSGLQYPVLPTYTIPRAGKANLSFSYHTTCY
jgi:hypothetical protein